MQLAETLHIDSGGMEKLSRYAWPGNVRELRNVLERALILTRGGPLTADHIVLDTDDPDDRPSLWRLPEGTSLDEFLGGIRYALINEALDRTRGNKLRAAELLGISRFALVLQLKKLQGSER